LEPQPQDQLVEMHRYILVLAPQRENALDIRRLGRPLSTREEYRQLVLEVLRAAYVFQYRYDGSRIVILRVFHGRESR